MRHTSKLWINQNFTIIFSRECVLVYFRDLQISTVTMASSDWLVLIWVCTTKRVLLCQSPTNRRICRHTRSSLIENGKNTNHTLFSGPVDSLRWWTSTRTPVCPRLRPHVHWVKLWANVRVSRGIPALWWHANMCTYWRTVGGGWRRNGWEYCTANCNRPSCWIFGFVFYSKRQN